MRPLGMKDYSLYGSARFEAVKDVAQGAFGVVGGLLGGGSSPASPTAVTPPPVPTVDQATVNAQQQEQSDADSAKKKGALSTLLNSGNTSTGDTLGAGSPETTLKRFLG